MAIFGIVYFLCISFALARALETGSDAVLKKQTVDAALQRTKALGREIWQNETARQTISAFFTDFQAVIDGKISGRLLITYSRLVKDLMKTPASEQNLEIISKANVAILTDQEASKNLQTILDNAKTIMSNKNTLALVRGVVNFFDELISVPQAPLLIQKFGEGISSFMRYDDPRKTVIGAFTNLVVLGGVAPAATAPVAVTPKA